MYSKPVGTVRPLQAEMGHRLEGGGIVHRPNILSRSNQPNFPVEALAKQGVSVQQITVPKGKLSFCACVLCVYIYIYIHIYIFIFIFI